MSNIQLAIVVISSILICILIIFYLYKDYLYKKQISNTVNNEDHNHSIESNDEVFDIIDDDYFSFVDPELDLIIDIVFFKNYKLKFLPHITTYQHSYGYYVYVNNKWILVDSNDTYNQVKAIRLVVNLIHNDDVLTEHRAYRIVQDLEACFLNKSYLRHNQFEDSIKPLIPKVKLYSNIEQYIHLLLITREFINYQSLLSIINDHGIVSMNDRLLMLDNNKIVFEVFDENCKPIKADFNANLISFVIPLHLQNKPLESFNKVVDFSADFNSIISARLMTADKQVMNKQLYNSIVRNIQRYTDSCNKKNIELGSPIIARIFDYVKTEPNLS